ncbi:MAG: hypothetical protein ACI91F_002843 [Candidatus Binatia bacterium]|jgi:hypothetical protein
MLFCLTADHLRQFVVGSERSHEQKTADCRDMNAERVAVVRC